MQRASSRPDFVIKGGSASGESQPRGGQTSRGGPATSRFAAGGGQRAATERAGVEQLVLGLQRRCVKAAEHVEVQAEKEAFYDQEIARLNKLIEAARGRKIKKNGPADEAKGHTLSTKEGFFAKGTDESVMKPSYLKSKISHVHSSINETKAKNKQLREVLNDLRKERAVLDECFTRLEKAINFKEQKLIQTLRHLVKVKRTTEDKNTKVKALMKHVVKEEGNFKNQYNNKVHELEKIAKDMNTSEFRQSIAEQEEIQFYSHEGQEGGFQDNNLNIGPNYSSVTFNNSIVDTIDNARMIELQHIQAMYKNLVVMTQEDDVDFLMRMYADGKQVNQTIYGQINAFSGKITEEDALTKELADIIAQSDEGMTSETRAAIQKIASIEQQIQAYEARTTNINSKIALTKGENALLDDILETIKDCLFIGDNMLNTDDAMVTNQKNHLIKLADERSSQLQFITKAMSGFAKQKEVTASFASTEKDEKQILHKIVEFNNSQLKSKESERNRDNLISENLKTMRKDLGNDINRHLGIDTNTQRRQGTQKRSAKKNVTKVNRGFTRIAPS